MAAIFWKKTFAAFETTHWPAYPMTGSEPKVNQKLDLDIHIESNDFKYRDIDEVTTKLGAAWALVLSQYAHVDMVVFGMAVVHQDLPCSHTTDDDDNSNVSKTTMTSALPMPIEIDWLSDATTWLQAIETKSKNSRGFGSWGALDEISKCTPEAFAACQYRTTLLIQDASVGEVTVDGCCERSSATSSCVAGNAVVIECTLVSARMVSVRLHVDDAVVSLYQARHILFQFENLFRQLSLLDYRACDESQAKRIIDLDSVCEFDKTQVWRWNALAPRTIQSCVQDLFRLQVGILGDSPAVDAWDGSLSYLELDRKSDDLAAWLLKTGIAAPGRIIPACFDKTVWTTITILAIAKAGSVFILLDPNQPVGRLQAIVKQLGTDVILARPDTASLAKSITEHIFILEDEMLQQNGDLPQLSDVLSHTVVPSDHLYIVFTSGSTGTPKGAVISHANLCSGVTHQARALGFAGSRTFDSSSYDFDAYVFNTFHTLLTGGCLCVPSASDRINNLQLVLQRMNVNFVQLTPSVSRLVDPSALPQLHTLVLTGEKITRSVLDPWLETGRVRVINAYGPSECTILCAANTNVKSYEDSQSVGFGLGSNLWIADVHDVTRLAPVGAVGEVLIEGPIVGQGYLGDKTKTRESLVHLDNGYLAGVALAPTGPLFRTRDLARYNDDGSISFIGRADTQIKINGQRVEIEEVEHHLARCLPEKIKFVVEPVQWPSGTKQLLAFICVENSPDMEAQLRSLVAGMTEKLSRSLPKYMIPSAYFPLASIPMTRTGKTDRKVLREMATKSQHLLVESDTSQNITSESEACSDKILTHGKTLRALWVSVLGVEDESIQLGDNFFSKGDSLSAMRLVSAAHREGFNALTVADILRNPKFKQLAMLLDHRGGPSSSKLPTNMTPFSLLSVDENEVNDLVNKLSQGCECDAGQIEDIFPCAPIQEQMFSLGIRNQLGIATQVVITLPSHIDITKLQSAWNKVASAIPILRTRICDASISSHSSPVLLQAIVNKSLPWSQYTDLNTGMQCEKRKAMDFGRPLFKLAVARAESSETSLIVTMHHAIYDGWFLNLVGEAIEKEYSSQHYDMLLPYQYFVDHLQSFNMSESIAFWKEYLKNAEMSRYPALPNPDYKPGVTNILERSISGLVWGSAKGVTPNTLIQTAWALILSKYSCSSDITFGTILMGRDTSLEKVERLGGPTTAIVPIRVQLDWQSQNLIQTLDNVQKQSAESMRFMHFGLDRIRKINSDTDTACQFQTFLIVQPAPVASEKRLFDLGGGSDDVKVFITYAIGMECSLAADGCHLRLSYDNQVVNETQMCEMLAEFERLILLLCTAEQDRTLASLDVLTPEEKEHIVSLKSNALEDSLHQLNQHLYKCILPDIRDSAIQLVQFPDFGRQIVAFISSNNCSPNKMLDWFHNVKTELAEYAPRHCLPTKCLVVDEIPVTASGEKDRSALMALALETPVQQLVDFALLERIEEARECPVTENEIVLQKLWAATLGVAPNSIGKASSFLYMGGNSLSAMRLVAALRKEGFILTVANVFESPRLTQMAAKLTRSEQSSLLPAKVSQFSLLQPTIDRAILAKACNVGFFDIEDAYPCSPMQEALIARTARQASDYVAHYLISLPDDIDAKRLENAWATVVAETPILRTRIVECAGHGATQVVIKTPVDWSVLDDTDSIIYPQMGLGQPLLRLAFVKYASRCDSPALMMSMHHAIYDNISNTLIMRAVESAYVGEEPTERPVAYNLFIKYLSENLDNTRARDFWINHLSDVETIQFPTLPSPKYQPKANSNRKHKILGFEWPQYVTPATTLKAAWSIVISQYTNCKDIVFGSISMGRQAPLRGIEMIAGPTIAIAPFRVRIDWSTSARSLLESIQRQATEIIQFEHYGLDNIRRLSYSAQQACHFQSLLAIQSSENLASSGRVFGSVVNGEDIPAVNMYGLTLECVVDAQSKGVQLSLSFDNEVFDDAQSQSLLTHMEHVLRQFNGNHAETLAIHDMDLVSSQDRHQILSWNSDVPAKIEALVQDLILERVRAQPDAPAICGWDGELSYQHLFDTALKVAHLLVTQYNIGPEVPVLVCCPKSVYTPVIMLAIMLAGGVTIMLDPSQPIERLKSIADQTGKPLVVASILTKTVAEELTSTVEIIDAGYISELPEPHDDLWMPKLSGDNALYITFTSGSTGTPKGAVTTHANCSSALFYQCEPYGVEKKIRTLDLSSYAFDIIWHEFLFTLYSGACLCVPSDEERFNDVAGAVRRFHVNYLHMTPSMARTIDPQTVPGIEKVVFGGEALTTHDIKRWGSQIDVRDGYGPTECTITSAIAIRGRDFTARPCLGRTYGLNAWVASCIQPGELAPIGAIGELVLEGPLVGRGYLNDPAKTKTVFIEDPPWLSGYAFPSIARQHQRMYKTGDLVKYNSDGRLVFVGRKDLQVKIRGQRIELEEIEAHARRVLGDSIAVAVEVIETSNKSERSQILMMFLSNLETRHSRSNAMSTPQFTRDLARSLSQNLPRYMVPSAFKVLEKLPLTSTGKTDRRALKEIGAQAKTDDMVVGKSIVEPRTKYEATLRQAWSEVLKIEIESISCDDNFFDLGGDSLSAIRLVGAVRKSSLPLSVALIFEHAQLSSMAATLQRQVSNENVDQRRQSFGPANSSQEFSSGLLRTVKSFLESTKEYPVTDGYISHILPLTDFQHYAVKCSLMKPPTEWNYFCIDFKKPIDIGKLEKACHQAVQSLDILRTIFVPVGDSFAQVVLNSMEPDTTVIKVVEPLVDACQTVCLRDREDLHPSGSRFTRFFIICNEQNESASLVMRISHSQYDGLSLSRLVNTLAACYEQIPLPLSTDFAKYVKHTSQRSTEHYSYWRKCLNDAPSPIMFPSENKSNQLRYGKRFKLYKDLQLKSLPRGTTVATAFTAAYGMALCRVTESSDIVFGRAVSGRAVASSTIDPETVVGPCLNLVPVRMKISPTDTAKNILELLQQQIIESISYETMGLREIVANCTSWPSGTAYGTVFYYQDIESEFSSHFSGQDVTLRAVDVEGPEPPEPPRINVHPLSDGKYNIELLVPADSALLSIGQRLLDEMVAWLESL